VARGVLLWSTWGGGRACPGRRYLAKVRDDPKALARLYEKHLRHHASLEKSGRVAEKRMEHDEAMQRRLHHHHHQKPPGRGGPPGWGEKPKPTPLAADPAKPDRGVPQGRGRVREPPPGYRRDSSGRRLVRHPENDLFD
jgi:hypothetical protein